jgi:uncharacterized membrane protein
MSELIAIAYPDVHRAERALTALGRMRSERMIDLDDAVYVTEDTGGKLKLHEACNLRGQGAAGGVLLGGLFGLLFLAPVVSAKALMEKFSDCGIDGAFVNELSAKMQPNGSTVFVLARRSASDQVMPELSKYGGAVLRTTLDEQAESRLWTTQAQGAATRAAAALAIAEQVAAAQRAIELAAAQQADRAKKAAEEATAAKVAAERAAEMQAAAERAAAQHAAMARAIAEQAVAAQAAAEQAIRDARAAYV